MAEKTQQAARPSAKVIAVAFLAGLVALLLLFPGSGKRRAAPDVLLHGRLRRAVRRMGLLGRGSGSGRARRHWPMDY